MISLTDFNIEVVVGIAAAAAAVSLISIIYTVILHSKIKKFRSAYISLQTFLSGNDLEKLLQANLSELRKLKQQVQEHKLQLEQVQDKLRNGIDRAELIRFNSFENMGAELSFALALLNQEGTGVVLTGIHSIEECRVYAKAVEKGECTAKLSQEEKLAIEKACKTIKV